MTNEYTFRGWFEDTLKHLQDNAQIMLSMGEEHIPMYLIFSSDTPHKIAAVPMYELPMEAKDAAFEMLRLISRSPGVHAAMFVCEAWVVSRDKNHPDPALRSVDMEESLEFAPDRKEAMIWNCLSHGEQLIASREIDRENRRWAGELQITDPKTTAIVGRMVDDDSSTFH